MFQNRKGGVINYLLGEKKGSPGPDGIKNNNLVSSLFDFKYFCLKNS